jgi:hypothetical protein
MSARVWEAISELWFAPASSADERAVARGHYAQEKSCASAINTDDWPPMG